MYEVYYEPRDENDLMLHLKDKVTFGERRYEGFKFATVYLIDGSFVGLFMRSSKKSLRVLYPAGWVSWVKS